MERNRKVKIIIMITLMVAITAMSLGFAAFSATLNISSSASVSPNSDDFKVVLSPDVDRYYDWDFDAWLDGETINGAILSPGSLSWGYVSNINAAFSKPNQSVIYTFYIHNIGEYDAYLKSVNISNVSEKNTWKSCAASTTDSTKATDSLVQAACTGIDLSIKINDVNYAVNEGNLAGVKLAKGDVATAVLTISYVEGSSLADGPFNVTFGDLSLEFSTVDNKLISFLYGDDLGMHSLNAIEGMTWREWVNSSFNTMGFKLDNNGALVSNNCERVSFVGGMTIDDPIPSGLEVYLFPIMSPSYYGSC